MIVDRCKKDPEKLKCVTFKTDESGIMSIDFKAVRNCECAKEKWRKQLGVMNDLGGFKK